jgi:hypothetical protein
LRLVSSSLLFRLQQRASRTLYHECRPRVNHMHSHSLLTLHPTDSSNESRTTRRCGKPLLTSAFAAHGGGGLLRERTWK